MSAPSIYPMTKMRHAIAEQFGWPYREVGKMTLKEGYIALMLRKKPETSRKK